MDPNCSNASESEYNQLQERLNMYKALNRDLSVRVQDLKVQFNAVRQENSQFRKELFDEREKNAQFRRYLIALGMHSKHFVNNFVEVVEEMDREGIDVSFATTFTASPLVEDAIHQTPAASKTLATPNLRQKTKQQNAKKSVNVQKNELQRNLESPRKVLDSTTHDYNLLNTITEESEMTTSTPLQKTKSRRKTTINKTYSRRDLNNNSVAEPEKTESDDSNSDENETTLVETTSQVTNLTKSVFENGSTLKTERKIKIVLSRTDISEHMDKTLEKVASNTDYESVEEDDTQSNSKLELSKRINRKRKSIERTRSKRAARPKSGTLCEMSLRSKLRRS